MGQEQDRKYRVTLTEDQLRIISDCLESESRMLCGQLEYRHIFAFRNLSLKHTHSDMFIVDDKLSDIKEILFPHLIKNASLGIGSEKLPDLMYDMYKEIRKELKRVSDEEDLKNGISVTPNVDDRGSMGLTDRPDIIVEHISQDIIRSENIDKVLNDEK